MSGSISSKSIGNNASTSHSGGHASQPPPANNPWHFGLKLPSLWTWFEGHYGLVLLGVVVATLFGILYWHLTRIESEQERTRKFIQKGGRIVVIVSAFLGIVVGSQIGSIADLFVAG
ncbi:hypothetical protein [Alicyclobacillus fodiniaquatilis]|uniref:Uncharacterized protein n=1 Tax=Alicyclobacillus fodiniaquatilis TaxID=1661150 RepID=A0ABW4JLZ3_9BACL